jgi:hypothetical protein
VEIFIVLKWSILFLRRDDNQINQRRDARGDGAFSRVYELLILSKRGYSRHNR